MRFDSAGEEEWSVIYRSLQLAGVPELTALPATGPTHLADACASLGINWLQWRLEEGEEGGKVCLPAGDEGVSDPESAWLKMHPAQRRALLMQLAQSELEDQLPSSRSTSAAKKAQRALNRLTVARSVKRKWKKFCQTVGTAAALTTLVPSSKRSHSRKGGGSVCKKAKQQKKDKQRALLQKLGAPWLHSVRLRLKSKTADNPSWTTAPQLAPAPPLPAVAALTATASSLAKQVVLAQTDSKALKNKSAHLQSELEKVESPASPDPAGTDSAEPEAEEGPETCLSWDCCPWCLCHY